MKGEWTERGTIHLCHMFKRMSTIAKHGVTLNIGCWLDRIPSYLGNILLGVSVKKVLDWVNWVGKTHPKHEWHHSMSWRHRLCKRKKAGWTPAFLLLDYNTVWSNISHSFYRAFSNLVVCILKLCVQANPSLNGFHQVFFSQHLEK